MVTETKEKVKLWMEENRSDLYTAAIIFLVCLSAFGLGRLSILWPQKEPLRIIGGQEAAAISGNKETKPEKNANIPPSAQDKYVASKSGTAYHYPWCAGAQKIKEENKIWFKIKEEAEDRGYKPAGNCDGL